MIADSDNYFVDTKDGSKEIIITLSHVIIFLFPVICIMLERKKIYTYYTQNNKTKQKEKKTRSHLARGNFKPGYIIAYTQFIWCIIQDRSAFREKSFYD